MMHVFCLVVGLPIALLGVLLIGSMSRAALRARQGRARYRRQLARDMAARPSVITMGAPIAPGGPPP